MANGVIALSSNDSRLESRIVWSSSSNGSSANTSNVYADLQVRRTDNYTTKGTWSGSLFIHDKQQDYSNPSTSVSSSWITMKSFTKYNVPHNHNGTGSCHIWGNVSAPSGTSMAGAYAEVDTWVTLDTIPRDLSITGFSVKSKTINTAVISWSVSDPRNSTHFLLKKGDTVIENWTGSATYGENIASDQKSGTFNIKNLSPNTTYKLKIKCTRSDSGLETVSNEISFTTYDYAKLSSVPNVNIGSAHTITWTNPAGATTSLKLCKTDNSTIIDYGTVTGTSKSITPTASTIYALTPNSNTYKARYILTTTQNGKTYTNSKDFIFTVTNSNPTFSNFTYVDNNSTTVALTGNNQKLIRYYSRVKATISTANKAVAKNSATMKKYRLVVGNKSTESDYNSNSDVNISISNIENNVISVYAIDSRRNSTQKSITLDSSKYLAYNKVTINAVTLKRSSGGIGEETTLSYNGSFWNNSFGSVKNSISSVKYYYRKVGTSTWNKGKTALSPTISGNTFSQTIVIQGDKSGSGFDAGISFEIKLVAYDQLMKSESNTNVFTTTLQAGTPLLAYHKNGIAIGKKYDTSFGGALQTDGAINGLKAICYKIANMSSNSYFKLGRLELKSQTKIAVFTIYGGAGQNARADQNSIIRIYIKKGWQSAASASNAFGTMVEQFANPNSSLKVYVMNISSTIADVYVYFPYSYFGGYYTVSGDYDSYEHIGTGSSTAPTEGTSNPVGYTTFNTRGVKTLSSQSHSNYGTNNDYVPDMSFIAYWNGAYASNNASNLTYCYQGTIQAKPTSLYSNSDGSNGTITLSQTAANFSYLEIYYAKGGSTALTCSVKIDSPNGKTVALNWSQFFDTWAQIEIGHIKISGTSITRDSTKNGGVNLGGDGNSIFKATELRIYKVLGYK